MNRKPLIASGTLLGIGLGGFIDGILHHQIFQVHSMLSTKLSQDVLVNVKISMFWDGLFHLLTWVTTAIGLGMLWHTGKITNCPWSGRTLWGGMIFGWGLFNLVEGIIDHYLLSIHHVVERLGLSIYDHLFLASGIVFMVVGIGLIRSAKDDILTSHPAPVYK